MQVWLILMYLLHIVKGRDVKNLTNLTTCEFVKTFNYPCERHFVTTTDGYILNVERVPHGRNSGGKNRPVLFVMHGLLGTSLNWFLAQPNKTIGFYFADAGFDVWFGNARGNKYSRNHTRLDPDVDAEFWNFSYHEIGYYDLPNMIDYVLNYTNQERLFYIGHSQGTVVYYIMLSEHAEYNDKIIAQYSISVAVYVRHCQSYLINFLLRHFDAIYQNFFPNIIEFDTNFSMLKMLEDICKINKDLCAVIISAIMGFDNEQYDEVSFQYLSESIFGGASAKQFKHFKQNFDSDTFQMFDYGDKNLDIYASSAPPKYNIDNIKTPIYVFYSENDWLSSAHDVLRFYGELPMGNKHLIKIAHAKWNHIDCLFSKDVDKFLNNIILRSIRKHLKNINYIE